MTTLTVNIDNKKSEKAVKAVLDALGISYNVTQCLSDVSRPLNEAELRIYKRLKRSLKQIKLYHEGKIELKSIEEVLAELS